MINEVNSVMIQEAFHHHPIHTTNQQFNNWSITTKKLMSNWQLCT